MKLRIPIWIEPSFTKTPWYHELIDGMQSESGSKKLAPRLLETPPVGETLEADMLLISGETSGWLDKIIRYAREQHVRVCVVSSISLHPTTGVSLVSLNREKDMQTIVHYFHHAGRKRIALWGINMASPTDLARLSGYRKAMCELQLPLSEENIYINHGDVAECARRLLAHIGQYDGVIASNDLYAAYLLDVLKKHGCRVPEDVFLAGFGNTRLSTLCKPSITTATLNHYELGRQAIKGIHYMLKNPDVSSLSIEITSRCHIRESTAYAPFDFMLPVTTNGIHDCFSSYDEPSLKQIAALELCLCDTDTANYAILKNIASDTSLSGLAETLFMSESTLNYRLRKLYEQIGVTSRQELCTLLQCYAPGLSENTVLPHADTTAQE